MKIRITGTLAELYEVRALLGDVLDVLEASEPHQNRGDSQLHRLYVEYVFPTPNRD